MLFSTIAKAYDYNTARTSRSGFGGTKIVNHRIQFINKEEIRYRIAYFKVLYFSRLLER